MASFCITAIFWFFLLTHISTALNDVNSTKENPMRIGIPATSFSPKFVMRDLETENNTSQEIRYTGFSIKVFEEVQKLLEYKIHYKFVEYNGTYDELVACVGNKTFDAAVGDITIIAERWDLVDFSVPYTESGLAMVVPVMHTKPWIFLKPFSTGLWLATGGILVYTMLVVWFLEHRSNPEFGGSWHNQLGNALWFTITSLFSAQRETVKSNHSRVVVVVWLFLALIIMQSFTASLTSWLTIKRLNPNVDFLRSKDAIVGCNRFIEKFVQNELGYRSENIKVMRFEHAYLEAFKSGNISAAMLEIPYAKILVNNHCKKYVIAKSGYKFGGLSFAFQKGSQMAHDVSMAILKLSENGTLAQLEKSWMTSPSECSVDSQADNNADSLTFESFWGLYLFSASVTTISAFLFIARMLMNYPTYRRIEIKNKDEGDHVSVWNEIVQILLYLKNAQLRESARNSHKVAPEIPLLPGPENHMHGCRFHYERRLGMKTRKGKRMISISISNV